MRRPGSRCSARPSRRACYDTSLDGDGDGVACE
ncbi:excalibur calcium-binding domain-containing protein [Nocardioides pacificus]